MSARLLLICLLLLGLTACSNPASKLPHYDQVPAFTMLDAAGQTFQSSALAGKVWVADFIYTNCPAACPMMSAKMHSLEKQVRGESDVRLISISVDPQRDTPAAMSAFAKKFGGPTGQWIFLTGSAETVHQLAWSTFHTGDVLGKIEHSTKFALVDKQGFIRGYYSSFDEDGIKTLLKDLTALRKEKS